MFSIFQKKVNNTQYGRYNPKIKSQKLNTKIRKLKVDIYLNSSYVLHLVLFTVRIRFIHFFAV